MRLKSFTVWTALAILATTTACEKASPTRPTAADTASAAPESMTDARTGATVVAARPLSPAPNAQIPYAQQPITLSVTNAITTGSSAPNYTFEVAGDPGFARKDYSRDNVAPGADGTTSLTIDRLSGSRTYYWRVQANLTSGSGPYSAVRTFAIGPEVLLSTPTLASPVNGASAFSPLSLMINNIGRTGPAGPIVYTVEIAGNEAFSSIVFTTEAAEQSGGQTVVNAPASGLSDGTTYYWRARATDRTNDITTPYSSAASFVAQSFNFAAARIWDNPYDLGTWPVGARITSIHFTGESMRVAFDRQDGPNRWPDVYPIGGVPPGLQYTLGICLNIQGQWNCSAVVQFWHGRSLDETGPPRDFFFNWWYEPSRWGPMTFYRPREGETIGVFAASGDLRLNGALFGYGGFTRPTCPRVCEVTNVVLVPFTSGGARYDF